MCTSYLTREAVSYALDRGSTPHVAFLDITKAFDKVWQAGLMHKLNQKLVHPILWNVVYDSFKDFSCCISLGSVKSEWFSVQQGVHQGGPMSMSLFQIFIDELLVELTDSGYGMRMYDAPVACPTYADDCCLISLSRKGLQSMLDIAYRYSRMWRFQFSAPKCVTMTFGENKSLTSFCMGKEKIPEVDEFVHLGTPIFSSDRGEKNMIADRIAEGYKRVWMIRGIGSRRIGINPLTFSTAYWSTVASKVLYGLEMCNCRNDSRTALDSFHFDVAKKIQGLPSSTNNVVPLSSISWVRLSSEIVKRNLTFHWQIFKLPMSSVYKQMLVHRLVDIMLSPNTNKSGPSVAFVENCMELGLLVDLKESVFKGVISSKNEWKSQVKKRIDMVEDNEWKALSLMTSMLHEYKEIVPKYKSGFPWWIVAKWNNKMLSKVKKLLKYMVMNIKECTTISCTCSVKVTLTHILFECESVQDQRVIEWSSVRQKMPSKMKKEVEIMSSQQKSNYLLSCFNSKPMREWQEVYESVLLYCENMINKWTNVNSEKQ